MLRRPISVISEFLRLESAAGIAIIGAAVLALLLVNSPAAPVYHAALAWRFGLPGAMLPLSRWINDGLMAVFFMLVGLEIKRELLVGELSSSKRALLPAIAAMGVMAFPALIYAAINWSAPGTLRGWAIPAATDIAFALGVIAILGNRVPASLKVFLTALAIIDDLGAITIIALFYTTDLSGFALGLAGAAWAVLLPLRGPGAAQEESPLHRLERGLHPCVAYGILPLFALTNAGLSFTQVAARDLPGPLPLGIAAGLFPGKQTGVLCGSWFAVKCGWAEWPTASVSQIYGIAVLCGIGFTMSLFIGGLAFPSDELQNQVKLGVFAVSALSAVIGYLVLRFAAPWSNE